MFRYLSLVFALLRFLRQVYMIYRSWALRQKARSEALQAIRKRERKTKDAADKISGSDMSDDDLNKRLQDGSF